MWRVCGPVALYKVGMTSLQGIHMFGLRLDGVGFSAWRAAGWLLATAGLAGVSGCAFHDFLQEPRANELKETVQVLTEDGRLVTVLASKPWEVKSQTRPTGLNTGEQLVGMDYRVARGMLYALGRSGQVVVLDADTQRWQPVGNGRLQTGLVGARFGFDFNPALDRIRVVSNLGQNMRLHPDTGLQVDGDPQTPGVQADPDLRYAPGDAGEGQRPDVVATAYTYNSQNDKITTNYVIDMARSTLVMQGSKEGTEPVESPNLGGLRTVGSLGVSGMTNASFDISDVRNTALMAATTEADPRTRLYRINLETGQATLLGTVADGARIVGMAIQP